MVAGVRFALLLGLGLLIGYSLERFGFGFAGPWRRLILRRESDGVLAQLLAIGLAAVIIQPLVAGSAGTLIGAIAPVSLTMVLGALCFGFAMQIVLGCGSGTLVNAGSGNLLAIVALPLFCIGSFIGSLLIPIAMDSTPHRALSLTAIFGVMEGVFITLGGLVMVGFLAAAYGHARRFNGSLMIAGGLLGLLAGVHLVIAGQPWGVVYGLGLWVAKAFAGLGWDPSLSAFWSHPINANALSSSILTDITSLTSMGLVGGAALAAWRTSTDQPLLPGLQLWVFPVVALAGLVLGISSRLAFGCNVGALFSGIASGSVHGWVWFVAGFLGSILGVQTREWIWSRAGRVSG